MNGARELLVAERLVVGRREPLLRDVDLCVRAGESWFLVGPNGCGKTTLLHTLVGLLPPLGGVLRLGDTLRDRRRLGFVPQEPSAAAALPCSVAEFVALGCHARRGAATSAAVLAGLEAMRIGDLRGRDVRVLSLGQRRRMAIARALARAPDLLLLDEPTANLDTSAAVRLVDDLQRLCSAGMGVVHVSHDLVVARSRASHLACVEGGRVVTGPVAALAGRLDELVAARV